MRPKYSNPSKKLVSVLNPSIQRHETRLGGIVTTYLSVIEREREKIDERKRKIEIISNQFFHEQYTKLRVIGEWL